MSQPSELFVCLRKHKDEEVFDKGCHRVIIARQRLRAQGETLWVSITLRCHQFI